MINLSSLIQSWVIAMRKNIFFYVFTFAILLAVILFFSRAYRELSAYSEITNRQHTVHTIFQNLSEQLNNAAIINPGLVKASASEKAGNFFFTDSALIIHELALLKSTVRDSINITIAGKLDKVVKSELHWLLSSNVPDSIIHHKAAAHLQLFYGIDSLINLGIQRTSFLIDYRKKQLNEEIDKIRVWVLLFVFLSGTLLIYTTINLFKQQKQRKRKEEELEIVLNRISDGVVSIDNEWRYTFLNDAAMATHPFSKEETIGKIIWDVHPEMHGTIFWDRYHEAMETKKVVEIESHYAPMNTWFLVKVYPSADGLTIFYKDISESKRSEQNLERSLKETSDYKYAIDESSIVAITDQKGIIQHANDNFCKISKYSREELIGQDHRIINSGHHSKEFIKDLWVTIANGKIWKGELKNKAKDGTIYWVDTTIVPFLNEEGKPYQYVAIRADITERKKVEENLEKSLKETSDYKYALEESSIVAITDQKGIIKYANDNFCKISKYRREELIGQDHRIINSGYHSKEFIKDLWITIANGKIWKGELKNKAKDGTIYWVDTTIVPFLDEEGKPYQYVAIRADITERKKVEQEIYQLNAELDQRVSDRTAELQKAKNKLSETLERASFLATIADNIQDPVISTDNPGDNSFVITRWNKPAEELLEWKSEEVIGKNAMEIFKTDYPNETREQIFSLLKTKGFWQGEVIYHTKSGKPVYVLSTISYLKDVEGNITGNLVLIRDITKRKEAEDKLNRLNEELEERVRERTEKLAASELHFRSLIENSTEGIALSDEHSNNIYRSPAAEKITGILPKENTMNRAHPDDLQIIKSKREEMLSKPGIPVNFQARFLHAAGHYFWMEGTFTNLLHVKGMNAVVTNFRDITQRKLGEEKLVKSERLYKTIASSIPGSVICLLDRDLRYSLIEGDMLVKLGYEKEKLMGSRMEEVLDPEIFSSVKKQMDRVFKGEIVSRDSSIKGYDIISKFIPLRDNDNVVYSIMTVAIDVTELKNAQRDINELNLGLEQKINERTMQLEIANKELESFSYSVSHDLRAPLRAVNGYAKMLEEDYYKHFDEEGKRLLATVQENARKMGVLIDDLLAFSRMGKKEINKSAIDMNALAKTALGELNKSVVVKAQVKINKLSPAMADNALMNQVWINLLSNAIKYSSHADEPFIEINSERKNNEVIYAVSDNGAGFDMQYAHKLFGVFQRLHGAEEFEGTGVGLALVQRIISKHGGKVWAKGEIGKGATFYFSLPIGQAGPPTGQAGLPAVETSVPA